MKKNICALLLLAVVSLTSCTLDIFVKNSPSDSSINTSSDSNSNSAMDSTTNSSFTSSSDSSYTSSTDSESIHKDLSSFTLNRQSYYYSSMETYSTGNYGYAICNNVPFQFYRLMMDGSNYKLLPSIAPQYVDGGLDGSIYNTNSFGAIDSLDITYYTSNSSGNGLSIFYGKDNYSHSGYLPASSSLVTKSFKAYDAQYIKVSGAKNTAYIQSITFNYDATIHNDGYTFLGSGTDLIRSNPMDAPSTLVPGETTVRVPMDETGTEYKDYTFYTLDYVSSNRQYIDDAAMLTPVDVANYYNAFRSFPANYALKDSSSSCQVVFGKKTRLVSVYNRTDGYVNAVPCERNDLEYYEFDIDLNGSYSILSRGAGRVVSFKNGFSSIYYEGPVSVYTDDHYATFQEYYNNGTWSKRFNAQSRPTNYIWGSAVYVQL